MLHTGVIAWSEFCELFTMVFLPFKNQEHVMTGILDHFQRPGEPLPTFTAHMLCEPSEQEQIELVCNHA